MSPGPASADVAADVDVDRRGTGLTSDTHHSLDGPIVEEDADFPRTSLVDNSAKASCRDRATEADVIVHAPDGHCSAGHDETERP